MIVIDKHESNQFQCILPARGSIATLELVNEILHKVTFEEEEKEIDFTQEELNFLFKMISFLDSQKALRLSTLSLIKKITNEKGDY